MRTFQFIFCLLRLVVLGSVACIIVTPVRCELIIQLGPLLALTPAVCPQSRPSPQNTHNLSTRIHPSAASPHFVSTPPVPRGWPATLCCRLYRQMEFSAGTGIVPSRSDKGE
jgi:hypothetical protein